jgi:hypothetical protein
MRVRNVLRDIRSDRLPCMSSWFVARRSVRSCPWPLIMTAVLHRLLRARSATQRLPVLPARPLRRCPAWQACTSLTVHADGNTPDSCAPCPAGQYSNSYNATACTDCRPGYYQNLPGQSGCLPCAGVFFSKASRAVECDSCPTGSYLVKSVVSDGACRGLIRVAGEGLRRGADVRACTVPWSQADCAPCPDSTVCLQSSPPAAQKDTFLMQREGGALASYACPVSTCLSGDACQASGSNNTVISCCAADRLPAVDAAGNVNLLCARCQPGLRNVRAARARCGEATRARSLCDVDGAHCPDRHCVHRL